MAETQETRIQQNHRKLTEQGYIPSIYIDYAVEGALKGTPLLIEGAPGVGKTSLAYQIERKAPGFSHGDISDWQV